MNRPIPFDDNPVNGRNRQPPGSPGTQALNIKDIFKRTEKEEGVIRGILRALPIVMGYVPVGFAFGVLAQKAGISFLNTVAMSLLVYAGAAQFIAVGLIEASVPGVSIVLTTLIVNLRHLIMTSALAPFLKGWKASELAAFSFQVTDETFAVHSTSFGSTSLVKREVFATNVTAQSAWVAGTWIGARAGRLVADVEAYALDYALPALFIALIVLQIKKINQVLLAIITGSLSVLLLLAGMDRWNIIIATLIGATLGVLFEQWDPKASS